LLGNVCGGLSGGAIKPIALKAVWDVFNKVKIPLIGAGGIMTTEDALEFILCGASAVQVGSANFVNPFACKEITEGLNKYFKDKNISDLRGKLQI
jgi:dihydroorotate dehydrogenase (NAD+) catalytic subunit